MVRVQLTWFDPNDHQQREYEGALPITIGRGQQNAVVLDSVRVSSQHARLEQINGQVMLRDAHSNNGTGFGSRLLRDESVEIGNGDRFVVAPYELTVMFVADAGDAPTPAAPQDAIRRTMRQDFPAPLHMLADTDSDTLQSYMERMTIPAGAMLFKQGDETDGCYLIDKGTVRLELEHENANPDDHDDVLAFVEANTFIGELSLLDRLPRSATGYAHTDLEVRKISCSAFDELVNTHPMIGSVLVRALGKAAALKVRNTTQRLDDLTAPKSDRRVDAMIADAEQAQRELLTWDEARIDALLYAIASTIYVKSEDFARAAVAETQIGNAADKTLKNQVASMGVYQSLMGQSGYGYMDAAGGIQRIASPVGVVFGLIPMTNPTSTFVFKTLVAIKSRNALILSPHNRTQKVCTEMGNLIRGIIVAHGAPEKIVQWVEGRINRKLTQTFMSHRKIGMILATGGAQMVKAAYSSGKPAIGVGPGNAPTFITASADLDHAAKCVVLSKTFDNGLICGAEHNLIVEASVKEAFLAALEAHGAAVLTPAETERLMTQGIDPKLNAFIPIAIGQPAALIASVLGIERSYPIKLLIVPTDAIDSGSPLSREKLLPLLSLFTAADTEDGINKALELLQIDGGGHTAIIHSKDDALIHRYGMLMPASRILVNSPGAHGVVGVATDLTPSLTLGCGTFGGTSTTDNVSFRNLSNVKRLAYFTDARIAEYVKDWN